MEKQAKDTDGGGGGCGRGLGNIRMQAEGRQREEGVRGEEETQNSGRDGLSCRPSGCVDKMA